MPIDYTQFRFPHPKHVTTSTFPKPLLENNTGDAYKREQSLIVKRKATGGKVVYPVTSDKYTITLPFRLSRFKHLELQAILKSYQAADWEITLYDDTVWVGKLTGVDFPATATERNGDDYTLAGPDIIEVTLVFSALRIT